MNLNPSKIKWNIRVRAQAIWRGITRETKEFRGLNIIFVDDSVRENYLFYHIYSSNVTNQISYISFVAFDVHCVECKNSCFY